MGSRLAWLWHRTRFRCNFSRLSDSSPEGTRRKIGKKMWSQVGLTIAPCRVSWGFGSFSSKNPSKLNKFHQKCGFRPPKPPWIRPWSDLCCSHRFGVMSIFSNFFKKFLNFSDWPFLLRHCNKEPIHKRVYFLKKNI
jgi:hypothetical protein